jgi:hypothetical protein
VSHRGDIVDANWSVRARDTGADRLDLMMPQFSDGANALVTQLDGYRYLVSAGEKAYYATIDETGDHILVPVVYHHPEAGDLGGTIYFHPQWWYAVALELELRQPTARSSTGRSSPSRSTNSRCSSNTWPRKTARLSYAGGRRSPGVTGRSCSWARRAGPPCLRS